MEPTNLTEPTPTATVPAESEGDVATTRHQTQFLNLCEDALMVLLSFSTVTEHFALADSCSYLRKLILFTNGPILANWSNSVRFFFPFHPPPRNTAELLPTVPESQDFYYFNAAWAVQKYTTMSLDLFSAMPVRRATIVTDGFNLRYILEALAALGVIEELDLMLFSYNGKFPPLSRLGLNTLIKSRRSSSSSTGQGSSSSATSATSEPLHPFPKLSSLCINVPQANINDHSDAGLIIDEDTQEGWRQELLRCMDMDSVGALLQVLGREVHHLRIEDFIAQRLVTLLINYCPKLHTLLIDYDYRATRKWPQQNQQLFHMTFNSLKTLYIDRYPELDYLVPMLSYFPSVTSLGDDHVKIVSHVQGLHITDVDTSEVLQLNYLKHYAKQLLTMGVEFTCATHGEQYVRSWWEVRSISTLRELTVFFRIFDDNDLTLHTNAESIDRCFKSIQSDIANGGPYGAYLPHLTSLKIVVNLCDEYREWFKDPLVESESYRYLSNLLQPDPSILTSIVDVSSSPTPGPSGSQAPSRKFVITRILHPPRIQSPGTAPAAPSGLPQSSQLPPPPVQPQTSRCNLCIIIRRPDEEDIDGWDDDVEEELDEVEEEDGEDGDNDDDDEDEDEDGDIDDGYDDYNEAYDYGCAYEEESEDEY